jgi:hypothetical protein
MIIPKFGLGESATAAMDVPAVGWYASYHPQPAKRVTTLTACLCSFAETVNERVLEDAPLARGAETYAAFALIFCEMIRCPVRCLRQQQCPVELGQLMFWLITAVVV